MDKVIEKKKWPPKKIALIALPSLLALFVLYSIIFGNHDTKLNVQNDFDKYANGIDYMYKRFGKEIVDKAIDEWWDKGYISDNSFEGDHVLEYMIDPDPEPDMSGYGMVVPKESLEEYKKAGYDGFISTKDSWANYDTVFSGEQAHILGNNRDIEMFKKWKEGAEETKAETKVEEGTLSEEQITKLKEIFTTKGGTIGKIITKLAKELKLDIKDC